VLTPEECTEISRETTELLKIFTTIKKKVKDRIAVGKTAKQ
jgi:hypothetical protein